MNMPKYPICFAEINCESLFTFRFALPEADIGRDDIVIYVEYGANADGSQTITYNVWAQFRNSLIRAFLCPGNVPVAVDALDAIPKIMYDLNSNKDFYETVNHFIAHFSR